MMTDELMAVISKMYRDDIDACNLIGVKQCQSCYNNKVPNVPDRNICMSCINRGAFMDAGYGHLLEEAQEQ